MDWSMALTALGALAGVLALVVLAGQAARRMGFGTPRRPTGAPRRLALVESLALDPRRRLLLLRCDDQEMLVLTGGPQDLLLRPAPREGAR